MPCPIGINPLTWTNDDMPELGGDTPLETCLAEAKVAGYDGMELDVDFVRGLREGSEEADWARATAPNQYWARHVSIVGGSNEIQRNILAKSVLGL